MTRTREEDRDNLKASLRALILEAKEALSGLDHGDVEQVRGSLFDIGQRYRQIEKDARAWDRRQ